MKKIFSLISLALAFCLFSPFAFAAKKFDLEKHSPAIIVTVVSNSTIPWQLDDSTDDTNDEGLLTSSINSIISANNPEYTSNQARIEYCQQALRDLFEDNGGIEVLPVDTVYDTPTFAHSKDAILGTWANLLKPEGSKILSYSSTKMARMIMAEAQAKCAIYANFKFEKIIVKGTKSNGRIGAAVTMECVILDQKGKTAKQDTVYAESQASLPIDGGKYDKDTLVDLMPDLIDSVINKFIFSI